MKTSRSQCIQGELKALLKHPIKSLKKENDDLKAQTESIMEELKKVKDLVNSKEINIAKGDHICSTSNKETLKSLD